MSCAKVYEVYDAETDKLLGAGIARELEEKLGLDQHMIRAIGRGSQVSTKYRVVKVSADNPKLETSSNLDAAKRWDAFCEPIRRKYGIPVKRMEDGK